MLVLLALFGATAGQGVVWYTGQFYAMTFIEKTCGVEFVQTRNIIAIALLIGTPFFIVFGALSDRIGRKYIMMTGMLLAALLYIPIYKQMYALTDVTKKTELPSEKNILRTTSINQAGDTVKTVVTKKIFTDKTTQSEIAKTIYKKSGDASAPEVKKEITLDGLNGIFMIGLVAFQVLLVTMVYGPIAAFLVELFPTRIRYTSMSLPYHIGNGIFGGLVPFIATLLYEQSRTESNPSGDPFAGLWYPIIVASITFVIGMIFLDNKRKAEVM